MRTTDLALIKSAVSQYTDQITGFYPEEWLANDNNVALTNEHGDVSLFEFESSGVVSGHYFYWSRGRKAVEVARNFLDEIFSSCYNIEVVRGLTPLENLGARWLNRQLKLPSYGVVQSTVGPLEVIIITKKEWESTRHE